MTIKRLKIKFPKIGTIWVCNTLGIESAVQSIYKGAGLDNVKIDGAWLSLDNFYKEWEPV